ncbi:AsmA family protein [Pseudomonadales bacterium]|nr:AsmA family protein [Pseudomonadales bacterium]
MSRKTLLFIIIIAVVASIAIGIVAALDNPEYYREKIQATAETETGFDIEINGELTWRYWPPIAISIEDVDVRPAGSDVPLATLKSAAVDLKLLPLLLGTGDLAIDGLNIDGLTVNAMIDQQGRGNWETDDQPSKTSNASDTDADADAVVDSENSLDLDIGAMSITNAAVSYIDASTGENYAINLKSLQTGAVSYSALTPVSFELALEDNASGMRSKITGDGDLSFNNAFNRFGLAEMNIENELNLPDVGELLLKLMISGEVDTAKGTADLNKLDFEIDELKGSVAVNVTEMNSTPRLDGDITILPFNAKNMAKILGQPTIETANPSALTAIALTTKLGGSAENIKLSEIEGKIDGSTITGRLGLRTGDKLTASFDLTLDQITVSDYLAPTDETATAEANDATSTPVTDAELLPLALLNENNINGKFTIGSLNYDTYTLNDFTTTIVNANQQMKATSYGTGYDGNMSMEFVAKTGKKPSARTAVQIKGMDVTKLTGVETLTGKIELKSNTRFAGSMLSDVLATLDGDSEFTVKDGTLDVSSIKNIAAVIDGLRKKTSSVASWPDVMPFKSMTGTHQINAGIDEDQRINVNIENMSISGTGGVDYWQNTMAYDMEVTLNESVDGQFTVGPAMAGIRWPLRCAGMMDATAAELCTPDSDSIANLITQILQKELRRQGADKLKEKGKKLFERLFN